jgi:predicted transcriptional regulator
MVSVASVICVICDKKVLSIFKTVALSENYNAKKLMTNLKLTRKQCYSRMEKLMQVGLIKRISGRYSLTSLGKVIFSTIVKIETAIKYYWKLKAIDTFMIMSTAYGKDLPVQECQRTMDSLIDNKEIKTILLSDMFDSQSIQQVLIKER